MIGTATGNVVDSNTVSGNTNGILVGAGTTGTTVRENIVVGNPAIQAGASRPDTLAVDILNLAPQGQTTFQRNVCITSVNAPCQKAIGQP